MLSVNSGKPEENCSIYRNHMAFSVFLRLSEHFSNSFRWLQQKLTFHFMSFSLNMRFELD